VIEAVPDAAYVIVGEGPEKSRLEKLVQELGLQRKVIFAGRVPDQDLAAFYLACDLFVQPNRTMPDGDTEGFGLVFLEAGACGKAVIGGNAGGVPEAVLDGITGFLVDGDSVPAMGEAMTKLLANRELTAIVGRGGRARALTFSWEATAQAFRSLCKALIATHSDERRSSPPDRCHLASGTGL
jgi:phosphatidylinositol alpha-1,6-mannosyltransferase